MLLNYNENKAERLKDPLDEKNLGKMILSRTIKDQAQIYVHVSSNF